MGVKVITTLVTPPASRLLTSLSALRLEFGNIAGASLNDTWCLKQILRQSQAIENYCNRPLSVATWQDQIIGLEDPYPYQVPGTHGVMQLSHWPMVPATPNCTVVQNFGSGVTQTLVEGTDFITDVRKAHLTRLQVTTGLPGTWEDAPATVTYESGWVIQNEAWTISATPPIGSAYQVVPLQADGPWQADRGVAYADGTALTPVSANPTAGQYAIVPATASQAPGTYQFAEADNGKAVSLSYAYTPSDLEDAVLRMISWRLGSRNRDPSMKSRDQPDIGRQEFWVGAPRMEGNLPAEIARIVEHYRVPVTA